MHLILEFWRDISLQGQMGGKNFIKGKLMRKRESIQKRLFLNDEKPFDETDSQQAWYRGQFSEEGEGTQTTSF